jgi:hypothetical protein
LTKATPSMAMPRARSTAIRRFEAVESGISFYL